MGKNTGTIWTAMLWGNLLEELGRVDDFKAVSWIPVEIGVFEKHQKKPPEKNTRTEPNRRLIVCKRFQMKRGGKRNLG